MHAYERAVLWVGVIAEARGARRHREPYSYNPGGPIYPLSPCGQSTHKVESLMAYKASFNGSGCEFCQLA